MSIFYFLKKKKIISFSVFSQVYRMFPFWYGHYPYQVAEYDCPGFDPWEFSQPRIGVLPEERWGRRTYLWRPSFPQSIALFQFFQVNILTHFVLIETTVVGGGKESPHLIKQAESYGHWQGQNLERNSWRVRQPHLVLMLVEVTYCLRLYTSPLSGVSKHWLPWDQPRRNMKRGRPEVSLMKATAPILSTEVWDALAHIWSGGLRGQEVGLVHLCILYNAWSFIMLNIFLLNWLSWYGLCP